MKRLVVLALLLVACSHSEAPAEQIVTPDGGRGVAVQCFFQGRNGCIVAISKACPHGYTITHEDGTVAMVAECK